MTVSHSYICDETARTPGHSMRERGREACRQSRKAPHNRAWKQRDGQEGFIYTRTQYKHIGHSVSRWYSRKLSAVEQHDAPIHICPSPAGQVEEDTRNVLYGSSALGGKECAREDTLFCESLVRRGLEREERCRRHICGKDCGKGIVSMAIDTVTEPTRTYSLQQWC